MNIKTLASSIAFAAFSAAFVCPLAAAPNAREQKSPEERRIERLKKNGGTVEIPGTGSGAIRFVNAQKRVADFDEAKLLSNLTRYLKYNAKLVTGDAVTPATAGNAMKKVDATVAIFIVDDPTLPQMLTAPEDRWAIVNVAKLAVDNPKPQFLAARTRKETLRALAFLTATSTYETSPLMSPIAQKPADLDEIAGERYPVDVTMRMHNYLKKIGVTQREFATYREALTDGCDIAPTNDYQKAIYEEVKSAKKSAK